MAVVLGTNAGFVTVAPTADPAGTTTLIDTQAVAVKDTAPVGSGKITEIGWWCDNATEETNFEVGLYSHNASSNKPATRLYVDTVNAKGTAAGWKTVVVDWNITAETIYWIAIKVDNTATQTNIDRNVDATRISIVTFSGSLSQPWPAGSTETIWCRAIYAVYESGQAPIIIDQSDDTIVEEGNLVNLFVTATGVPTPEYQWYKNDILLDGEINDTLSFISNRTDAGTYKCKVYNTEGEVYSDPIVLTVQYLEVTAQSDNQAVNEGESVNLFVIATGIPEPEYQWYFKNV